jgi:hypothetical protein
MSDLTLVAGWLCAANQKTHTRPADARAARRILPCDAESQPSGKPSAISLADEESGFPSESLRFPCDPLQSSRGGIG